MYIDILLALAFVISVSMLTRRISEKVPDLVLIPDQDISVLLEENTAKIQRFFLHIFHFRSFYRKRHYHERLWSFTTKCLLKMHILLLRIDNSIMRLMKRMRSSNEMEIEQRHDAREYFSKLQEDILPIKAPEKVNRVLEIRTRRRKRFTENVEPQKTENSKNARLPNDKNVSQKYI